MLLPDPALRLFSSLVQWHDLPPAGWLLACNAANPVPPAWAAHL